MITVGLTGGIGSGKSSVAAIFKQLKLPVFYSDAVAKDLYNNPSFLNKIEELMGQPITHNGQLDKKKLATLIFNDKKKKAQLEKIVFPLVREKFQTFIETNHQAEFAINESALLFESGSWNAFDYIIHVMAPRLVRIQRVKLRDNISTDTIEQRIANQLQDD